MIAVNSVQYTVNSVLYTVYCKSDIFVILKSP